MKTLLFLAFFTVLGSFSVSAQMQYLWIGDSTVACNQTSFFLSFYVDAVQEQNPTITVYWGDGTTDVIDNAVYPAMTSQFLNFTHSYTTPGSYNIHATFLSSVDAQLHESNAYTYNYYGVDMCGQIYPYVYQSMNCGFQGSWYYEAIYDVTDGNGVSTTFNGNLQGLNVNAVPYTLSLNDEWLEQNNLTQLSGDITITSFDSYGYPSQNLYFEVGTLAQTDIPDYVLGYAYAYGLSPLEELRMYLWVYNQTCSPNGTVRVSVTFPSDLVPNTSNLTNPLVSGNVLSFDVTETYYYYYTYLTFYMPGTTPAGTELEFNATVADLSATETNLSNNSVDFTGIVYNSYDPNNKLVNKGENINPNQQEDLIYTINFQNEGNFDAINVKVIDTLSENLDLSTFQVLNSKHNVVTSLDPLTRIVEFKFQNANLTPSSQDEEASKGFVTYVVREKVNLPMNSVIDNTAHIYFDFNPAIVTNTTHNVNAVLAVSEKDLGFVQLVPNPSNDGFFVKSAEKVKSVSLKDVNGKTVLKTTTMNGNYVKTDALNDGIYFVEVETFKGTSVVKLSVVH